MQAIGPLGLPAVIAGLDALLVAFALYRFLPAPELVTGIGWSKRFLPAGLTARESNR